MVGENFELYLPQMARKAFKLSTMVGENFEIYWPQLAQTSLKLSTMVRENFEICWPQVVIFKGFQVKFQKMQKKCVLSLRILTLMCQNIAC